MRNAGESSEAASGHPAHEHAGGEHQHAHEGHENHGHDHGHDHAGDHGHVHVHGDDHGHPPDHGHEHPDEHAHGHDHGGWMHNLGHVVPFLHDHSHDIGETASDRALEGSAEGIRVVALSLVVLGVTAAVQVVIAIASGSVGLLADTIHNAADALTAIPLWIAFTLGRRPPDRRYTYGYGRAEDAAGLAVVGIIFISAVVALVESIQKLIHPQPMAHVPFVALGAIVGFVGNEVVAIMRTRTGRRIGSAALVADGQHAQADGLTSLAVLVAVAGAIAGFPILDPIIGLVITAVIVVIGRDAGIMMWRRLMDAVDPEIVERIERVATSTPGALRVSRVRARWIGHRIIADLEIDVDESWTVAQGHELAEEVHHRLLHEVPRLASAHVHVDPYGEATPDPHRLTAHHAQPRYAAHEHT